MQPPLQLRQQNMLARDSRSLGAILRRARKLKGLSQTALGDITHLRQETISQIESGDTDMKLSSLLAVLSALELDLRIGPRETPSIHDLLDKL
ncbi:MAG: helix-turn-helix domain-containing protein [Beijerinckiaceae bacterium]